MGQLGAGKWDKSGRNGVQGTLLWVPPASQGGPLLLPGSYHGKRDLDRHEWWAQANLMKLNKAKCKVLCLGWSIPSTHTGWVENGLRAVLRRRIWECQLVKDSTWASKANHILGCIKRNVTRDWRRWLCPSTLFSWGPTWSTVFSSGAPSTRRTESCWSRSRGGPWRWSEGWFPPHEDRLRDLGLFSLEKRRLQRDLIEAFQYLKGTYKKLRRDFL